MRILVTGAGSGPRGTPFSIAVDLAPRADVSIRARAELTSGLPGLAGRIEGNRRPSDADRRF